MTASFGRSLGGVVDRLHDLDPAWCMRVVARSLAHAAGEAAAAAAGGQLAGGDAPAAPSAALDVAGGGSSSRDAGGAEGRAAEDEPLLEVRRRSSCGALAPGAGGPGSWARPDTAALTAWMKGGCTGHSQAFCLLWVPCCLPAGCGGGTGGERGVPRHGCACAQWHVAPGERTPPWLRTRWQGPASCTPRDSTLPWLHAALAGTS